LCRSGCVLYPLAITPSPSHQPLASLSSCEQEHADAVAQETAAQRAKADELSEENQSLRRAIVINDMQVRPQSGQDLDFGVLVQVPPLPPP
jgi:hypothetical protein